MINSSNFTIGADPEAFLFNTIEKKYVPASRYLMSNTKTNPHSFGGGFQVLRDNMMIEWNQPPSSSKQEWMENTIQAINLVSSKVNDASIEIKMESAVEFSDEDLKEVGGNEFGCAVAYNANAIQMSNPEQTNMRMAGGHIHIGIDGKLEDDDLINMVRILDYNLYIPSLALNPEDIRRDYYGLPGNFRQTSFGLEYRVLSNFWLQSEELINWVYDQVSLSVKMLKKGEHISYEQIMQSIKLKEQV